MRISPDGESPVVESILVVEDDPGIARLVDQLMRLEGLEVRVAGTLSEARSLLAAALSDLVILDRQLPDGDGLDLARELRSGDERLNKYVVMLTAQADETSKLEAFDLGADDYVTKPFDTGELRARVRAGLRLVRLQRALMEANQRLEVMSLTDPVTGIANRRAFDETLDRAFALAVRHDRPLSVVIADIDHFKAVNDTWGHPAGDAALRDIAARISSVLRKSDSLARLGGEEFAVVLPETALGEAVQVAEKIRTAVAAEPFHSTPRPLRLTMSVGVASVPHSKFERGDELLGWADRALYRAKNRGRNRTEAERRAEPWRPTRIVLDGIPMTSIASAVAGVVPPQVPPHEPPAPLRRPRGARRES